MRNYQKILLSVLCIFINLFYSAQPTKRAVYFEPGSNRLNSHAIAVLDSFIKKFSDRDLELTGHCDYTGNDQYNGRLSENRLAAVRKHLLSKGIIKEQITINSFGEKMADTIADEKSRVHDRRVEIAVRPKKTGTVMREFVIKGSVLNEEKKALVTEISLNDYSGKEIAFTKTEKDGTFSFKANLSTKGIYSLVYYNDSSFVSSQIIRPEKDEKLLKSLSAVLPMLRSGKSYHMNNLNFIGGSSELIPASKPVLGSLRKLMRKNKNLVIVIEGHVNIAIVKTSKTNFSIALLPDATSLQELSEKRALMVQEYLLKSGIAKERMSTIGYGSSRMLFPEATSEDQQEQNRRVEIKVVSF